MSATLPGLSRAHLRVGALGPGDIGAGVIGRFREVVSAQPDAVAVAGAGRRVGFGRLAVEAAAVLDDLRQALRETPAVPHDSPIVPADLSAGSARRPVALLHAHEAGAVAGLLAILASGHPVLVLDHRTPPARLRALLERVDVQVCVSDAAHAAPARELVGTAGRVVLVGGGDPLRDDPGGAGRLWADPPAPTSTAVIAFTSGSTGVPKVVANDHEMLVRDAWVNSEASGCYGRDDVIAHTLPMGFHAGLMATVAGLLVGCTMKLYDVRGTGIGGLAGWLEVEEASVLHTSPAIARAFVATRPRPAQLSTLRSLTIAGEAAYGTDVEALRSLLPAGCTIRNRYGSSETGLIAEFVIDAREPLPEGVLPTGFAVPGTVLALVDEDGVPVPDGEPGIVTVTAAKTASGYWHDPAASAAAFSHAPDRTRGSTGNSNSGSGSGSSSGSSSSSSSSSSRISTVTGIGSSSSYRSSDLARFDPGGRLTLLGRRDHSVKIRGYLVEPGEIDAALFALDDVREAVTVGAARPGDGRMRLVAYVVSTSERPSAVGVRAALHTSLPGYMVPETVVFLDVLPRTERGKLDRSALPPPPAVVPGQGLESMSEWESVVAGVWERVLALDVVGREDDFFELGGDSLAAEQLMSALVLDLGVPEADARTTLLAEAPTLGAFARRLRRRPEQGQQTLIPLQTGGDRPPLFMVAGAGGLGVGLVPMAKHLGPEQPCYALQAYALERPGIPDWSVRAAARRHVRSIRAVQPQGPYHVGGHSFGGLVALEIAHQLRAQGQDVDLLVVLDSFPPDPARQPLPPARSIGRRLRDGVGLLATGVVATPGLGQYWRFHRQSMLLSRWYRCPPWPGRTLLVVADTPEREIRADWAPHLSGDWEAMPIGGDHLAMMREPWAAQIAAAVTRHLHAVTTARATPLPS